LAMLETFGKANVEYLETLTLNPKHKTLIPKANVKEKRDQPILRKAGTFAGGLKA